MRIGWSGFLRVEAALVGLLAASCVCRTSAESVSDYRRLILSHIAVLDDGWDDWLWMLQATHVVSGVVVMEQDPMSIRDEYLDVDLRDPMFLLGSGENQDELFVFNSMDRHRHSYLPFYSDDLARVNGRRCLLFLLHGVVLLNPHGEVQQMSEVSTFEQWSQLDAYLQLARADPVQLAALVARRDIRVERVLEQVKELAAVAEGKPDFQPCSDKLQAMGVGALPGILHAMVCALGDPSRNTRLSGAEVALKEDGQAVWARACEDIVDFLALVAVDHVSWNWETDPLAQLRLVRIVAVELLRRNQM